MIYYGMDVEPVAGEPTRFLVASGSGQTYLVDIASYSGNGKCGCQHFEFRLEPKVKMGAVERCKHILAAREMALDLAIAMTKKNLKNIC